MRLSLRLCSTELHCGININAWTMLWLSTDLRPLIHPLTHRQGLGWVKKRVWARVNARVRAGVRIKQ